MRPIERILILCCIIVFGVVPFSATHAAEITVSPGSGTLAIAVQNATSGDTLILDDGSYYGNVTLDKSLTIRSLSRSTQAILPDTITIDGPGIDVTMQGLEFRRALLVRQAGRTWILENYFPSGGINAINYVSSPDIGSLVIIGNRLLGSGNIEFDGMNVYVAGNVVANGQVRQNSGTAWIVGNKIQRSSSASLALYGDEARVIGNHVACSGVFTGTVACVDFLGAAGLFLNNIVQVQFALTFSYNYGYGVRANGGVAVRNNVIYCDKTGSGSHYPLDSSIVTEGNIFVTDSGCSLPASLTGFTHNLCWGFGGSCPPGNLDADPQFIDLVDFRLGPGSPAIDAGPPDIEYADLDRTRNDMGARGGSWNIDQFDPQRDPYNLAPFVYPIVTKNSPAAGDEFELRAIGAAKLR